MSRLDRALALGLTVARLTDEHEVKYPAAALAYYAFVSQVPLLVLLVAGLSDRLLRQVRAASPVFLTPDAQQLMAEALSTASGRAGAALLAVVVLGWSWANIVTGFQTVIERVEAAPRQSLPAQLRDAVSILGSFGLVVVSIILTNGVFALLPTSRLVALGEPVVRLAMLTIAFLPLYYAPSRTVTSLWGALPGSFTTAFGWTVLLTFIQLYAANAAQYALYGILSGIIIILTSLYVAAVMLMIGVVVNTVVAGRGRDGVSKTRLER